MNVKFMPQNEILGTRLRVMIQLHAETSRDESRPNATAKRHNDIARRGEHQTGVVAGVVRRRGAQSLHHLGRALRPRVTQVGQVRRRAPRPLRRRGGRTDAALRALRRRPTDGPDTHHNHTRRQPRPSPWLRGPAVEHCLWPMCFRCPALNL